MGLNIDGSIRTNKPVSNNNNKKKGLEKQTEKALNDYNSIREKIDTPSSNRILNKPTGQVLNDTQCRSTSKMSFKTRKFIIA